MKRDGKGGWMGKQINKRERRIQGNPGVDGRKSSHGKAYFRESTSVVLVPSVSRPNGDNRARNRPEAGTASPFR